MDTTVDQTEIAKFEAMAAEWWDPKGKFAPLHKFNPARLSFIREKACDHFGLDRTSYTPLQGLSVLDIGCGGGLLSEPLTRMGARVTGIDMAERNVKTAQTHALSENLDIHYRLSSVEDEAQKDAKYDIVLNMEVVEHVADVGLFLRASAQLVAPGGLMVVATLNRTVKALALVVVGAEYVLGWLPRGTHDFEKFVKPHELKSALRPTDLKLEPPVGLSYNPLNDSWSLSRDTAVNYMVVATKPA